MKKGGTVVGLLVIESLVVATTPEPSDPTFWPMVAAEITAIACLLYLLSTNE